MLFCACWLLFVNKKGNSFAYCDYNKIEINHSYTRAKGLTIMKIKKDDVS